MLDLLGRGVATTCNGTTRRDFLKGSIAAAVAAGTMGGLGAYYFKYSRVNDPLRIGVIGTGDEGGVLIGALNPEYIDVRAIAEGHLDEIRRKRAEPQEIEGKLAAVIGRCGAADDPSCAIVDSLLAGEAAAR